MMAKKKKKWRLKKKLNCVLRLQFQFIKPLLWFKNQINICHKIFLMVIAEKYAIFEIAKIANVNNKVICGIMYSLGCFIVNIFII